MSAVGGGPIAGSSLASREAIRCAGGAPVDRAMTQLTLLPDPDDHAGRARHAFARIRDHLRRDVVGHEDAIDHLSVMGVQHLLGQHGQRLLLVGPSGVGKTTLARSLAAALDVPFLLVDVAELAETNWHGVQLADSITELWTATSGSESLMARALVVLDEIDKVTREGSVGAGSDYRRGKQESLLGLLGGAEVRYGTGGGRERDNVWSARRAIVIGAGVFPGLPRGRDPSPADFIRLGLMSELVERFGLVMRLAPLDAASLIEVLRRGTQSAVELFATFGLELRVPDTVLSYVASAVASGIGEAGPRSGVSCLLGAAQRRLVELLREDACEGMRCTLSPDDVHLPAREGPGSGTR